MQLSLEGVVKRVGPQTWLHPMSIAPRSGAVTGEKTPQAAMDNLAEEMDSVMARLERAGMAACPPKLNAKKDPGQWLSDKGAPWAKLANEKPKGETIAYDTLLNAWKNGKVR